MPTPDDIQLFRAVQPDIPADELEAHAAPDLIRMERITFLHDLKKTKHELEYASKL